MSTEKIKYSCRKYTLHLSLYYNHKIMYENRIAVSIMFFVNGFMFSNWVARMPEIQALYGLNEFALGLVLLTSAVGALIAMPFAGWFATRFGSYKITGYCALGFCFFVPFVPILHYAWALSIMLFMFGLVGGAMDVSMNEQAVLVEKQYKKSIMSSFHAVFSIGTALGAGVGALFTHYEIPLFSHFTTISIFSFLITLYGVKDLVRVPLQQVKDAEGVSIMFPSKAILPLGIIAFCGMTGEGSLSDWSAIYLTKVLNSKGDIAALGFVSFASAMTIGRIFGDYTLNHFGKRKVLIFSSLCAFMGLSIALGFLYLPAVFIGFFLVGLGLANVVPVIYSTAGNTEGVAPSVGIAMATTIGYAGFFIGPPLIGFLGKSYGLRTGLCFTLFLFMVMFVLVLFILRKK